ncbi:YIP1 family protein [Candidatus Micrarchaeota archaeon]|nr:YIP1 family protein [Candidatus Micrarchaeota archaeon]
MGFFEDWKEVLTQPKETFASRKKEAEIGAAAKTYALLGAVVGLLFGLMIAILGAAFAAMPGLGFLAAMGFLAIPVAAVAFAVLAVIGSFISAGIYFVFAKLLGGTGDFKTHYYLPSLYVIPVTVLTLVLNMIPFLGSILGFVLGLYNLYLMTLAYKEAHGLSTLKAVLVWLLPIIVIILLVVLLMGSLIAVIAGAGAARGA